MSKHKDRHSTSRQQPSLSDKDRERIELCRKGYDEIAAAQSALLDKTIITISGAAFTIAMGFIDKIIPLETAKYTFCLWIALAILGLTIIMTTLSFYAGEKSARKWRKACDEAEEHENYSLLYGAKNYWSKVVNFLNVIRLCLFVGGISMLAGFILYNGMIKEFPQKQIQGATVMSEKNNKPQLEQPKPTIVPGKEGFTPPPPPPPASKPTPPKK